MEQHEIQGTIRIMILILAGLGVFAFLVVNWPKYVLGTAIAIMVLGIIFGISNALYEDMVDKRLRREGKKPKYNNDWY